MIDNSRRIAEDTVSFLLVVRCLDSLWRFYVEDWNRRSPALGSKHYCSKTCTTGGEVPVSSMK